MITPIQILSFIMYHNLIYSIYCLIVCVCVCVYLFPWPPPTEEWYHTSLIFKQNTAGFHSYFFLLLDGLPYQGKRTQSALLVAYTWRWKWIHIFPRGISMNWNTVSSRILNPIPFLSAITPTLRTSSHYIVSPT